MSKNLEIYGYSNKGYEGQIIKIDTDIHPGFPGFDIIGLPDSAIKESRDRVRTALRNCNFKFPQQHVLVSLSPASVPKQGASLDLGIALSILFSSDKGKPDNHSNQTIRIMTAGELALDGTVVQDNSCIGAIDAAKKLNCHLCLIPFSVNKSSTVFEIADLATAFIKVGEYLNSEDEKLQMSDDSSMNSPIFEDVIGLNYQKELLSICASGMHSILLFGPPGVGKTMLSTRYGRLLPPMDKEDYETVVRIQGCAGTDFEANSTSQIVAHDCSMTQFVGGTGLKSPGIGALSHCGALILDEIVKYSPKLLEAVKDAYDKGYTISCRSGDIVQYPARFVMVGNLNACPCGGLGSNNTACTCNAHKIESYWSKIGRPLLERFDARIPIEETDISSTIAEVPKPDSYYIDRIQNSADRQVYRYKDYNIKYNGQLHYDSSILSMFRKEIEILSKIENKNSNNVRNIIGIVSMARSVADWDDRDETSENDILVALKLKKYGIGDYFWRTIR